MGWVWVILAVVIFVKMENAASVLYKFLFPEANGGFNPRNPFLATPLNPTLKIVCMR